MLGTKLTWTSILCLTAGLATASCSSDERARLSGGNNNTSNNNNNSGTGSTQAAVKFCGDFFSASIDFYVSCFGGDRGLYERLFETNCGQVEQDVSMGKLAFNTANATQCLAAIQGATCTTGFEAATLACRDVYEGLLEDGEPCDYDLCVAGQYCDQLEQGCSGVCRAQAAIGEACRREVTDNCVAGAFCDSQGGDPMGTCVARRTVGEPCRFGQCADGLRCADGECIAPAALGEPCQAGFCDGLLLCTEGPGGSTCQLATRIGEACDESAECVFGACGSDGRCPAPALPGDACGMTPQGYGLCWQSYCTGDFDEPGVCMEYKADGESCESATECESRSCDSGVCVAPTC